MPQGTYSLQATQAAAAPGAGGTVTPDATQGEVLPITMPAGNITVANPANAATMQKLVLIFTQDGVGGRTVTWGANFKTTNQPAPAANAVSIFIFQYDGTNWQPYGAVSDQAGNVITGGVKAPQYIEISLGGLSATSTSLAVFIADGAYQLVGAQAVFSVTSTSGTLQVTVDTGTQAPGAGTVQLTGTVSLSGVANTVVAGTVIAAPTSTAVGNRVSLLLAGTLTGLANLCVSLQLKRV